MYGIFFDRPSLHVFFFLLLLNTTPISRSNAKVWKEVDEKAQLDRKDNFRIHVEGSVLELRVLYLGYLSLELHCQGLWLEIKFLCAHWAQKRRTKNPMPMVEAKQEHIISGVLKNISKLERSLGGRSSSRKGASTSHQTWIEELEKRRLQRKLRPRRKTRTLEEDENNFPRGRCQGVRNEFLSKYTLTCIQTHI